MDGRQRQFFAGFAVLALLCTGCAKFVFQRIDTPLPGSVDWPFAGGSTDRSSQRNNGVALPLEERLRLKMTSAVSQNMVISDGILYVPTLDGRLTAINLAQLRVAVRRKLPRSYEATCAVVDSSLVIAQRYGGKTLLHYNVRTGKQLWQVDGGDIASEPLIADSLVVVAALDKYIAAYRRADGRRQWQYRTSSQIHASPALAAGVLVVGTDNGLLLGLQAANGSERWELDTRLRQEAAPGGGIYATPIIRRQTVYVGTVDQEFLAVDLFSGQVRWRLNAGSKVIHAAAANDTLVVFGANDGRVRGVGAANGAVRWEYRAASVIGTSPTIVGTQVYFGALDHTLYCLDTRDGTLLWHRTLEGRVRTNPVVWEHYLITACEDNLLYIFKGANVRGTY